MKTFTLLFASAVTVLLASSAQADLIDVNFTHTGLTYQMSGAAEIGSSGDEWNNLTNVTNSAVTPQEISSDLIDTTGTGTNATLTLSGFNGITTEVGGAGPSAALFDYAATAYQTTTATLTFAGLADSTSYELVVYGANVNDNGNYPLTANSLTPTHEQTDILIGSIGSPYTTYTNTQPITSGPLAGIGAEYALGNYEVYSVKTTSSGSLQLSVTGQNGSFPYYLPGLQLKEMVAAPEPSTLALMIGGLAGLLIWVRRSKSAL